MREKFRIRCADFHCTAARPNRANDVTENVKFPNEDKIEPPGAPLLVIC